MLNKSASGVKNPGEHYRATIAILFYFLSHIQLFIPFKGTFRLYKILKSNNRYEASLIALYATQILAYLFF